MCVCGTHLLLRDLSANRGAHPAFKYPPSSSHGSCDAPKQTNPASENQNASASSSCDRNFGPPTSHLNDLSLQCHHSPALVLLKGHLCGLLHVPGHQGVPQGKVECRPKAVVFYSHHVEEPRAILGRTDRSHILLPHFHLAKEKEHEAS